MTKEDLFNAMDGIDEKSLVRASSDKKKIKTGSVVSGIVVAVLLCAAAFPFSKLIGVYLRGKIDFESKITEPVPTETETSETIESNDDFVFESEHRWKQTEDGFSYAYYNIKGQMEQDGGAFLVRSHEELNEVLTLLGCSNYLKKYKNYRFNEISFIIAYRNESKFGFSKRLENANSNDAYIFNEFGETLKIKKFSSHTNVVGGADVPADIPSISVFVLQVPTSNAKLGGFDLFYFLQDGKKFASCRCSGTIRDEYGVINVPSGSIVCDYLNSYLDEYVLTNSRSFSFRLDSLPGYVFSVRHFTDSEEGVSSFCGLFRNRSEEFERGDGRFDRETVLYGTWNGYDVQNIYVVDSDNDGTDELYVTMAKGKNYNNKTYEVFAAEAGNSDFCAGLHLGERSVFDYVITGFEADGGVKVTETDLTDDSANYNELGYYSPRAGRVYLEISTESFKNEWKTDRRGRTTGNHEPGEASVAWDIIAVDSSIAKSDFRFKNGNMPRYCLIRKADGLFGYYSEEDDYFGRLYIVNGNDCLYDYETGEYLNGGNSFCTAVYLCDCNGDGYEELFINVSSSSEMKDGRVLVYDIRNGHRLIDLKSEDHDYFFYLGGDSRIHVKKTEKGKRIAILDGGIGMDGEYVYISWDDGTTYNHGDDWDINTESYEFTHYWNCDITNRCRYVTDAVKGRRLADYRRGEDLLFNYNAEYVIVIPKLTIDTDAARLFNERLLDSCDYNHFLYGKDDDEYTLDAWYMATEYNGVVEIAQLVIHGIKGSDSYTEIVYYYYDISEDRELTLEEFAEKAGMSVKKINESLMENKWAIRMINEFESDEYLDEKPAYKSDLFGIMINTDSNRDFYLMVSGKVWADYGYGENDIYKVYIDDIYSKKQSERFKK